MRRLAALLVVAGPALAEGPLPPNAVADYQLGGGYPPPPGVTVVVRDSTDTPAPGLFNICYVNGFQTQPGADWPVDVLVQGPDGPLADPGWPDEFLLDISTPEKRAANLAVAKAAILACAEKGFDAVEFDNLDSYTRSGGYLTLGMRSTSRRYWSMPQASSACRPGRRTPPSLARAGGTRRASPSP